MKAKFVNENKKLELSAGLVVIQDNKILLIHPTNSLWKHTFSIPKGHVEEGEELIDAAIRETAEETGIDINKLIIDSTQYFIDYTDNKGKVYKRVYYFLATTKNFINEDDLNVQEEEADWAGFLSKEEASSKIFWRFKELLNYLK